MPTPGSHNYDISRSKLAKELRDQGWSDDEADREATARMAAREDVAPPVTAPRAAGPLGERDGGGDPGDVIDLRSPAFNDHTMMPSRHAQADGNRSPALEWSPPPDGTAELALVCEDLDAPQGVVTHWLVTGIDPGTTSIEEGRAPDGRAWPNVRGRCGYDGPQPPAGDEAHRYVFRVLTLDEPLEAGDDATTEEVRALLDDRRTASGTLVGLYAR